MTTDRSRARALAKEAVQRGDAVGWFEPLYRAAAAGEAVVPWADLVPNPHLVAWLDRHRPAPGAALDVGCGLGDNAEELARRGHRVLAFDVAASAIAGARARFPQSPVEYVAADLLAAPAEWRRRFALVCETYTLQVLPPAARRQAVAALRELVAPGGCLLVIARLRTADEPEGEMPWPLLRSEVDDIASERLRLSECEEFWDDEQPPVRRVCATFVASS